MNDLIEALTIINKYIDPGRYAERHPTSCDHDILRVHVFNSKRWKAVRKHDKARLKELSFEWDENDEVLSSYRFGSA